MMHLIHQVTAGNPERTTPSFLRRADKELTFQVVKSDTGTLLARNEVFALEYVADDKGLTIRYESLAVGPSVEVRWRQMS